MLAAKVIESRISLQINELRHENSALIMKAVWWSQFCYGIEHFARLLTFNRSPAVGSTFHWAFCPILHFLLLEEKVIKSFSFFLEVVNSSQLLATPIHQMTPEAGY